MIRTEMLFDRSFLCENDLQDRTVYSNNGSDCPIYLEQVLRGALVENSLSIGGNILALIAWMVLFRIAGFIALKLLHASHKPKASSWKRGS